MQRVRGPVRGGKIVYRLGFRFRAQRKTGNMEVSHEMTAPPEAKPRDSIKTTKAL